MLQGLRIHAFLVECRTKPGMRHETFRRRFKRFAAPRDAVVVTAYEKQVVAIDRLEQGVVRVQFDRSLYMRYRFFRASQHLQKERIECVRFREVRVYVK